MIIENIKINNFRNISKGEFSPGEKINIIYGNNGNGKTSYIEAIHILSNLKSFKTNSLFETIKFDNNKSEIQCDYRYNLINEKLDLEIHKDKKKYNKNGKKCQIDDYLWSLMSIIFQPDDILYVNGPPSKRRELIDKAIFFIDKNYIKVLRKLYKSISNKNTNLKNNKINNIEEWNYLIAEYSAIISFKRDSYIERINKLFGENRINGSIVYSIKSGCIFDENEYREYYLDKLNKNIDKEIKYKYSIYGAHRQDFKFDINDRDLRNYGSQGQKRSFILMFRASQIFDFKNINKFFPVLLLDDMASELDDLNRNIFIEFINNFLGQIFITSTDKNILEKFDKAKYFHVEDGIINSFS